MPVKSASLFKVTVFILAVPAILFLALTILIMLIRLVSGPTGGISMFAFGFTVWELRLVAAAGLGTIIFLGALIGALFRRHRRQKASVDR